MIVSNEHVERMADLDATVITELERLIHRWSGFVTHTWQHPCFMFEHGGRTPNSGTGGCVAHAHLQLLPLAVDPVDDYDRYRREPSVAAAIKSVDRQDYLLVIVENGYFVTTGGCGSGQFFRRRIARLLASPDEWDYLLYPRHANMLATLRHGGRGPGPDRSQSGTAYRLPAGWGASATAGSALVGVSAEEKVAARAHRAMGTTKATSSGIQWVSPPTIAGPASRPT